MRLTLQIIWILTGLLTITLLSLGINVLLETRAIIHDVRDVTFQMTADDIRKGLAIIEKQLDNERLALENARTSDYIPISHSSMVFRIPQEQEDYDKIKYTINHTSRYYLQNGQIYLVVNP